MELQGSWWIEEPQLLGTCNPTPETLEQLRREGFTVIVSLLDESAQPPRYDPVGAAKLGFTRHNIPVADFQAPTLAQLEQFVALVQGLPRGTKTLVHCQGGIGRTGTFAAAYLAARGLTADAAIQRIREARPGAVETNGQKQAIRQFEKTLRFEK
jgi:atypical dual specificity phosphatase